MVDDDEIEVTLISWPDDDSVRDHLALAGRPRLLLVARRCRRPTCTTRSRTGCGSPLNTVMSRSTPQERNCRRRIAVTRRYPADDVGKTARSEGVAAGRENRTERTVERSSYVATSWSHSRSAAAARALARSTSLAHFGEPHESALKAVVHHDDSAVVPANQSLAAAAPLSQLLQRSAVRRRARVRRAARRVVHRVVAPTRPLHLRRRHLPTSRGPPALPTSPSDRGSPKHAGPRCGGGVMSVINDACTCGRTRHRCGIGGDPGVAGRGGERRRECAPHRSAAAACWWPDAEPPATGTGAPTGCACPSTTVISARVWPSLATAGLAACPSRRSTSSTCCGGATVGFALAPIEARIVEVLLAWCGSVVSRREPRVGGVARRACPALGRSTPDCAACATASNRLGSRSTTCAAGG